MPAGRVPVRWGLRSDACGASTCPVGAGVAPTGGGWCGAAVGAVVLGLARECALVRERRGRASRCGRPPPPRPLPAASGYTDTGGGAPANCGHSCRWGDGGTSRSSEAESGEGGRGGTSLAPRCADTPGHTNAGASCGRRLRPSCSLVGAGCADTSTPWLRDPGRGTPYLQVDRDVRAGRGSPFRTASSASMPRSPNSSASRRTVVSSGSIAVARARSSIPVTERSEGTRRPRRRAAL